MTDALPPPCDTLDGPVQSGHVGTVQSSDQYLTVVAVHQDHLNKATPANRFYFAAPDDSYIDEGHLPLDNVVIRQVHERQREDTASTETIPSTWQPGTVPTVDAVLNQTPWEAGQPRLSRSQSESSLRHSDWRMNGLTAVTGFSQPAILDDYSDRHVLLSNYRRPSRSLRSASTRGNLQ